eukprot:284213-Rhodomonas_salina.2
MFMLLPARAQDLTSHGSQCTGYLRAAIYGGNAATNGVWSNRVRALAPSAPAPDRSARPSQGCGPTPTHYKVSSVSGCYALATRCPGLA